MRNIITITQVTLDGVMQSPGGPEEDPSNGFTHGGWAMPFLDDALNQAIGETIAGEFDMLLGRRTYEIFAAYWPNQGGNPIAKAFNKATKYVVTHSLDHLDWEPSLHLGGDVVDEVRRLKASDGPALHIWGSRNPRPCTNMSRGGCCRSRPATSSCCRPTACTNTSTMPSSSMPFAAGEATSTPRRARSSSRRSCRCRRFSTCGWISTPTGSSGNCAERRMRRS